MRPHFKDFPAWHHTSEAFLRRVSGARNVWCDIAYLVRPDVLVSFLFGFVVAREKEREISFLSRAVLSVVVPTVATQPAPPLHDI